MTLSAAEWNKAIASLPGAHVLQTWQWGAVKLRYGWQPAQRLWHDPQGRVVAAALVLSRSIRLPVAGQRFQVWYVPKGPLLDWGDVVLRRRVLSELARMARRQAIFIKIDPDVHLGLGIPSQPGAQEDALGLAVAGDLQEAGWHYSAEQIQFRNTVLVDLTPDSDTLLANMKQKTRYNLRLAERKGVVVRAGGLADLELLYQMYAETSARDGFVIRDEAYYCALWTTFMNAGMAEPLIAEVEGEPVAALMLFWFAGKAWYLYGMSRQAHREKMPNYLLQWEAMQRAKQRGCRVYDLWGAPDQFDENDSMWGVFRFKEGLGGQVMRGLGAWDLPLRPFAYRMYTQILPRWLDVLRRRGKERTRQMVS